MAYRIWSIYNVPCHIVQSNCLSSKLKLTMMPRRSLNIKCCENIKDEKRTVQTLWDSFGEPDSWPGEEPKPQKGIGLYSICPRNWSISLWSIMDHHGSSMSMSKPI